MKNHQTGVRIARRLHATEHALDTAMQAASLLLHTMIEGRVDQGLAAEVGQAEIDHVIGTLTGLAAARRSVVASHTGLAVIAEQTGLGWRMDGSQERKIEPKAVLVASIAA